VQCGFNVGATLCTRPTTLISKKAAEDVSEIANVALSKIEVLWSAALLATKACSRWTHLSNAVVLFTLWGVT
jgi:hypothetical protein